MSSENKSAEFKIIFEEIGKEYMDEFELLFNDVPFTGDNYSAELSRVEIRPLKSDGDSIHLFVKSAPTDPKNRKTVPPQIMFKTEIMLYSEVLPALNRLQEIYKIPLEDRFRVAKLYKSVIEEFKELMVMEDLSIEGFTLHDKRVPLDLDHVILLLKYFARLHATSFALRKHDPELFSKFNISQMHVFKDIWLPISRAIEPTVLQSIEFPRHKTLIESFVKRTVEILDSTLDASLTEPYNVICHGDCWSSNLLFKYKEGKVDKVIPVDWQVSRLGSPATDIAYMICMCTDLNSMRSHIDQMLDIYYETLREATARMDCDISVMLPKDVLIEHFKKYMLLALCIAFTGLPISLGDPESLMDIGSIVDTSQKRPIVNDRATQRIIGLIDYCVDSGLLK